MTLYDKKQLSAITTTNWLLAQFRPGFLNSNQLLILLDLKLFGFKSSPWLQPCRLFYPNTHINYMVLCILCVKGFDYRFSFGLHVIDVKNRCGQMWEIWSSDIPVNSKFTILPFDIFIYPFLAHLRWPHKPAKEW